MTKNSLAILAIAATCLAVPVGPALAKSVLDYGRDGREYFLAPLHWETHDWEIAGGVVLGIAASHLLDGTVRDQFRPTAMGVGIGRSTRDALPLAALFAGTLAVGVVGGDRRMLHTTWDMGEAVALSSLSAQALKVLWAQATAPDFVTEPLEKWR